MTSTRERPRQRPERGAAPGGDGRVAGERRPFRFGWRDHLINLGFWTLFGAVTAANFLSNDYEPAGYRRAVPEAAYWLFHSYLWAAVTPLVFWLVWRLDARRTIRPAVRAVALVGAWLVLAALVYALRDVVWEHALGFPPRSGLGEPGSLFPGWPRLTDEPIMCAAIFAAGFVREYLLRNGSRQEEAIRLQARAAQAEAHAALVEAHAAQLQAQLAKARLAVLRSQLNPHFLFNTLNAVCALLEEDPAGAHRMIARLSELLRRALQGREEEEIPLREELSLTERYLEILEIRFQGRLRTSVSADPDVGEALVPNLILQPLVENAMKHGVGRAGGRGRIEVRARRSGDSLVLTVRDTGAGEGERGPGELGAAAGGTGVGLSNARARLRELYGTGQRLSLAPLAEGGTIAEIVLPFRAARDPVPT